MTILFDYHIHSKYSGCSRKHGEYDLLDAYSAAIKRGYSGIGMSDHCNYKTYNANFIYEQKRLRDNSGYAENLLIGLEITIINKKGDLGVNSKYLKDLDYYIISEHIHIAKPFSEFYHLKQKFMKWKSDYMKANKIKNSLGNVAEMVRNAINKNPRSILAHIWRFPRNVGYYSTEMIDLTYPILEELKSNEVAFELHSGILQNLLLSSMEDKKLNEKLIESIHPKFHEKIISPKTFFKKIISESLKYDIKYAFGSDAHKIGDIGRIGNLTDAKDILSKITELGIKEKKIIRPDFFKIKL